jgi:epoxyqueuosine reductase
MISQSQYSLAIKQKALSLGFSNIGISKAVFLEDEAPRLENWLNQGLHGKMSYMENHFDKRLDPRLLVDGAKSVVSFLYNYFPSTTIATGQLQVSKYAYGEDYHFVVKEKLVELLEWMKQEIGEINGRVFVDSAPVLERAWAAKSGLGWVGKNGNIINKQTGSFFFLAEMIIDLELENDLPTTDHCGSCTACLDACPTNAIIAPQQVDGSKCISYFTIELKEHIPTEMKGKFDNWIFGCDICQDVCPWNRFSIPHHQPRFEPSSDLLQADTNFWKELTEETFHKIFKKSPVQRTKYNGLIRNIDFVLNSTL